MALKFVLAICMFTIVDLSMVSNEVIDGKWCEWAAFCVDKHDSLNPIEPCEVKTLTSKLHWMKREERRCGGSTKVQHRCCLGCHLTTCYSIFYQFFNFFKSTKSNDEVTWHKRASTRKGCGLGFEKYVMCPNAVSPTPDESITEIFKRNCIEF